MRLLSRLTLQKIFLMIVAVFILISLLYTELVLIFPSHGGGSDHSIIAVDYWVPAFFAVVIMVGLYRLYLYLDRAAIRLFWPVMILASIFMYGLCFRMMTYDYGTYEIGEDILFVNRNKNIKTINFDDRDYCTEFSSFHFSVRPLDDDITYFNKYHQAPKKGKVLTYFRGIWPSRFSEESIQTNLGSAGKKCPDKKPS